jgi:hypothetical protein
MTENTRAAPPRRIVDLVELALDRRTSDNSQTREDWCAVIGLQPEDVARTTCWYFSEQHAVHDAEAPGNPDLAITSALIDLFLYGLMLGREI